jgi:hypothetical protein
MACRTASRLSWSGGPPAPFPPSRCRKALVPQERNGNPHRHYNSVQAYPGTALKVIEPEMLFQLKMRLLTRPTHLKSRC